MCTSPPILEMEENTTNNLLPEKSKEKYLSTYSKFMDWRQENNVTTFSENVLLVYFQKLSDQLKPSSLWTMYSMLKSTIFKNNNINIESYSKLIAFLKRKSFKFKSTKSKILTCQQINDFIERAPDNKYLFMKAVSIVAQSGACRKQELRGINLEHIEDTGKSLIITIANPEMPRSFVVSGTFYKHCKKYMNLRPPDYNQGNLPLFIRYTNGKCYKCFVGVNTIGAVSKNIASFLGLPEPNLYTGRTFRQRSSLRRTDPATDKFISQGLVGSCSSTIVDSLSFEGEGSPAVMDVSPDGPEIKSEPTETLPMSVHSEEKSMIDIYFDSTINESVTPDALGKQQNEFDLFGCLVAKKMEKYSLQTRARVQLLIMDVLTKADLGTYDEQGT